MENQLNQFIVYLRKSRSDSLDESIEETLAKHEKMLTDMCLRQFGGTVPNINIYREVISGGESIDERIEIKKALSRCEDEAIEGIICIEPQRLSRGSLTDCDRLIDTFRYNNVKVITLGMTYDLENKMQRQMFENQLMQGRQYLDYVKEILMRGRISAAEKGCFCYTKLYGYDKVRIGKDYTLTPNADAETVKSIFDWYVAGMSARAIATRLTNMGIKSPSGMDYWNIQTINKILKNIHYCGKITFQRRPTTTRMVDGKKVTERKIKKEGYLITEGKHPAIVSLDTFERVQALFATHPPVKAGKEQVNVFAGLIICSKCGKRIQFHSGSGRHKTARYECTTPACSKSVPQPLLDNAIIQALEQSELPNLMAKWKNGEGESAELKKKRIASLEKELAAFHAQEEKQYDLLETGKYTQELFDRRNKALRDKMQTAERQLKDVKTSMPHAIDYEEKVLSLQDALQALKDGETTPNEKNRLLREIVSRIELTSKPTEKKSERDIFLRIELKI